MIGQKVVDGVTLIFKGCNTMIACVDYFQSVDSASCE